MIFFYTSKILTALASPLALALVVFIWTSFSLRGRLRILSLSTAALLLLLSTGCSSHLLLRSLESRYAGTRLESAPAAEAIVVLGGGLVNTAGGSLQLGSSSERLWIAALTYRAGKAPLILVTGGSTPPAPAESVLAARILLAWGVPASAILTEEQSRDTHQNAASASASSPEEA